MGHRFSCIAIYRRLNELKWEIRVWFVLQFSNIQEVDEPKQETSIWANSNPLLPLVRADTMKNDFTVMPGTPFAEVNGSSVLKFCNIQEVDEQKLEFRVWANTNPLFPCVRTNIVKKKGFHCMPRTCLPPKRSQEVKWTNDSLVLQHIGGGWTETRN